MSFFFAKQRSSPRRKFFATFHCLPEPLEIRVWTDVSGPLTEENLTFETGEAEADALATLMEPGNTLPAVFLERSGIADVLDQEQYLISEGIYELDRTGWGPVYRFKRLSS